MQIRAVSNVIACGIQPIQVYTVYIIYVLIIIILEYSQNLRVLKYVGDEKKVEWGKHWIEQGFNGMCTLGVMKHQCAGPLPIAKS